MQLIKESQIAILRLYEFMAKSIAFRQGVMAGWRDSTGNGLALMGNNSSICVGCERINPNNPYDLSITTKRNSVRVPYTAVLFVRYSTNLSRRPGYMVIQAHTSPLTSNRAFYCIILRS